MKSLNNCWEYEECEARYEESEDSSHSSYPSSHYSYPRNFTFLFLGFFFASKCNNNRYPYQLSLESMENKIDYINNWKH